MISTKMKVFALAASVVLALGGTAMAQATAPGTTATPVTPANNANAVSVPRQDERGFDWGWLGLIGLAGLSGLTRKDRTEVVGARTSVR